MSEDTNYVVLATRTPLYAPLYLAKQAHLDSIFENIEFRYGSVNGTAAEHGPRDGRPDQLVTDVLTNPKCLAGIADPFRALENTSAINDEPYVPWGLVQHMFFWLIDRHAAFGDADRTNVHNVFDQIVVTPKYMTGYKLACHHLVTSCGIASAAEADQYLFSDTMPGYEAAYYKRFRRIYNRRQVAYITPDVRDFMRKRQKGLVKHDFALESNYKNSLMTGIIVSRSRYQIYPEQFESLQNGINAAVEMIYRDPLEAAWKLRKYRDEYVNFSDLDETHKILTHLAQHRAFPSQGRITSEQLANAFSVRVSDGSAESLKLDRTAVERHFDIAPRGEDDRSANDGIAMTAHTSARFGAWVEASLLAVAREEKTANTNAILRTIVGLGAAFALLVLDLILYIPPRDLEWLYYLVPFLKLSDQWVEVLFIGLLPVPLGLELVTYLWGRLRMGFISSFSMVVLSLLYLAAWAWMIWLSKEEMPPYGSISSESYVPILFAILSCIAVAGVVLFYVRTSEEKSFKIFRRRWRELIDYLKVRFLRVQWATIPRFSRLEKFYLRSVQRKVLRSA